jgi:BirA family biotin operon repressor/biotin-[acetyl-CoA-carboxylase] ligase
LSTERLADLWSRAGLEAPVRFDEVTGSTNAAASDLARAGAPEWTAVAAGHQTDGRGRLGRAWADRPGSSLLLSIVLRPSLEPEAAGGVALLAGACTAEAAAEVADAASGCKWPNDVLVAGRKAAGILVEGSISDGRIDHLVLGIGVNLWEAPLEGAGAVPASAPDLLAAFLDAFVPAYRDLSGTAGGGVQGAVDRYRPWCVTLGRRVRATTVDGASVEGEAVDLDRRGGLLVETDTGTETVAFGAVEHLRDGPPILG